jgi:SAM-dependent methyltransferase
MLKRNLKRLLRKSRGYLPYYRRLNCPICGTWARNFDSFGLVPRPNARCPSCGALERHRLAWLFFQGHTDLFAGGPKKVLHFAPEPVLSSRFSQLSGLDYTTADLNDPAAMVKADITDLQFPDETFDVVYCSHVLEHVPDDRRAMRECRRVLKHGGYAVMVVPITAVSTAEDPSITDPKERERLFGQSDHVRRYGPDFADRLREAGFEVSVYTPDDVARGQTVRSAIPQGTEPVYLCRRR